MTLKNTFIEVELQACVNFRCTAKWSVVRAHDSLYTECALVPGLLDRAPGQEFMGKWFIRVCSQVTPVKERFQTESPRVKPPRVKLKPNPTGEPWSVAQTSTSIAVWVKGARLSHPYTSQSLPKSLGWEDSLEKGKATHFSILAWRIPWTV